MKNQEIIAIMQAHEAGKTIQLKNKFNKSGWLDCGHNPSWNFDSNEYRIVEAKLPPTTSSTWKIKPRKFLGSPISLE